MEKRKLNILFIANEYPLNKGTEYNTYGGQASYLQNISNLIRKKKHNVTVFLISNRIYNSTQNDTLRILGSLWIASLLIFSAIGAFFAGLAG